MNKLAQYPLNGRSFRLGILGGGQLGRMLCQAAIPYDVEVKVIDPEALSPASQVCHEFVHGSFQDYDSVVQFAQDLDALTVEIENVNIEALEYLADRGLKIAPSADVLRTIRDKGIQKRHYAQHDLPTMPFELFEHADEVRAAVAEGRWKFPFVLKTRTGGYDGQGVMLVRDESRLDKLFDTPVIAEQMCNIDKEIAVIIARDTLGGIVAYDPVEMVFDPEANLIDYLRYPANLSPSLSQECIALALRAAESFQIEGLLAVELFITQEKQVVINEVAPRPHNSGHQSIESSVTSQYEQHLRILLDLPLGDTTIKTPSLMLNLVGASHSDGPTRVDGMKETCALPGTKVHLYGKKHCRAGRKMGHVTIVDQDLERAAKSLEIVRDNLVIRSH